MEIGIFGLPLSGKTTIFSLLTGVDTSGSHRTESHTGVAKIYDERVAKLSEIFKPKKTTYATLSFIDIPSFDPSANRKEKNRIFQFIQNADALLAVVRTFRDPTVPWPVGAETPKQQLDAIITELLLRDMEVVENRIQRLNESSKKKKLTKEEEKELEVLGEIKNALEEEKFVSQLGLEADILKLLGSLSLFTAKPLIIVANTDDEQFTEGNYDGKEDIKATCEENGFAYMELSGKIEMEINELEDEEKEAFMEELGIKESGIQRLSRVVYEHIGLMSFLTVGDDEVRAWTIKKGSTAREAAGKIHTDLAKNFIRAEVIPYQTFIEIGDMHEAKNKGLVKLVGRDEIIHDGDIVHIRANA